MKSIKKYLTWPVFCGILTSVILFEYLPFPSGFRTQSNTLKGAPPLHSYATVVKKTAPSVVNIFTTHKTSNNPKLTHHAFSDLSQYKKSNMPENLGSGVLISPQGYIVTNSHVIHTANDITVMLTDGRQATAELINQDSETDLAILKIELPNLPTIQWGNSSHTEIGDVVLAIGNPFGLGQTVSQGIISATHRHLHLNTYESYLQTDAAINSGNSGGPLVNNKGELIGITTAILSTDGGYEGLGFAIPSNQVKFVSQSIIKHGRVVRGWLGIELNTPDMEVMQQLPKQLGAGLLISNIFPDSPAQKFDLKRGDLITSIDNKAIYDPLVAVNYIATKQPGKKINLKINRNGQTFNKTVKIDERPDYKDIIKNI